MRRWRFHNFLRIVMFPLCDVSILWRSSVVVCFYGNCMRHFNCTFHPVAFSSVAWVLHFTSDKGFVTLDFMWHFVCDVWVCHSLKEVVRLIINDITNPNWASESETNNFLHDVTNRDANTCDVNYDMWQRECEESWRWGGNMYLNIHFKFAIDLKGHQKYLT